MRGLGRLGFANLEHIRMIVRSYARADTAKGVVRKFALLTSQRVVGRSSECAYTTFHGLKWDPHFQPEAVVIKSCGPMQSRCRLCGGRGCGGWGQRRAHRRLGMRTWSFCRLFRSELVLCFHWFGRRILPNRLFMHDSPTEQLPHHLARRDRRSGDQFLLYWKLVILSRTGTHRASQGAQYPSAQL